MRLATYNLRAGGSAATWRAAGELHADLSFLQEARDPATHAGDLFSPVAGVVWSAVPHGRWGSALLSREPVQRLEVPGFQGWVEGGLVRASRLEFLAFSVHIPAGPYVRQAGLLIDALRPIVGSVPVVLAGDWNVAASRRPAGDVIPFPSAEARILDRLMAELGLVSSWQAAHPVDPLPQTLRWTRQPTLPYHCDGIFVPESWTEGIRAEVLSGESWNRLSDHNPVVAEVVAGP